MYIISKADVIDSLNIIDTRKRITFSLTRAFAFNSNHTKPILNVIIQKKPYKFLTQNIRLSPKITNNNILIILCFPLYTKIIKVHAINDAKIYPASDVMN